MPPQLIIDPATLDLSKVVFDIEAIRRQNPQRFEMEQLTAICHFDPAASTIAGYKDVSDREFWVRGHIPGRPLMPGVIMIEAAAQLSSFYFKQLNPETGFVGFGGVTDVKFRGQVPPGSRLLIVGQCTEMRRRRAIFNTQGFVDNAMVFEAVIVGMPI
jgi:3-hydroxyacyl-[acyl-carrier-protein] dehydratase